MTNEIYSLIQANPFLLLVIYWVPFLLSLIFIKIYNKTYPHAYKKLKENHTSAKPLIYSLSAYGLFSYLFLIVSLVLGGFMSLLLILK